MYTHASMHPHRFACMHIQGSKKKKKLKCCRKAVEQTERHVKVVWAFNNKKK